MFSVSLPKKPEYEKIDEKKGKVIVDGCYPGYGTTLGNAIRRVLLSSLPGFAITTVKIKGITHEFSGLKNVKEDVVQIILNLKKVRFSLHGVDEATIFLKVKGEKEVKAKDFKLSSEVELANPDEYIATLTSSTAELDMEVKIQKGLGFITVEQQEREEKELGAIAIDAIYSPVKRVNFLVGNTRVGKRTDYDKITLEIDTDGTIDPKEAFDRAVEILLDQFGAISAEGIAQQELAEEVKEAKEEKIVAEKEAEKEIQEEIEKEGKAEELLVEDLDMSTRTMNVLKDNGTSKISQLVELTKEDVLNVDGLGEKAVKEIEKALKKMGLALKSE